MSKQIIKIVIGSKKIVKKIELDTKLNKLREILKDSMPGNCYFMMEDAIIEKNDEQDYTIKDIEKDKKVICSMNTTTINIYLNDKLILKLDIGIEETIESLSKEIKGKIPADSKIKFEDTEMTIEEAKNEEMTIKDIASENSIYFINEGKSEDQTLIDEEPLENKEKKSIKFVHIYKNGDVIKMGDLDTNINLYKLRELIKGLISQKARFLSEGIGVPIDDEKNIKVFNIIKEDKIYIQEEPNNISQQHKPVANSAGQDNEKIPVILKYEQNSTIIKVPTSMKLDRIREINKSIIKDNYCFTYKNSTTISKEAENSFSIGEVMDESNNVILKDIRPKVNIKIMEDNKSVKS